MWKFLSDRNRKARLFEVACCRRVWDALTDERGRTALEVVERYVDGQATEEELSAARKAAEEAAHFPWPASQGGVPRADQYAVRAAFHAISFHEAPHLSVPYGALAAKARALGLDPRKVLDKAFQNAWKTEAAIHADFLRDILGPLPFRPVPVDPSWLEWNGGAVVRLAQSIYDDRRFGDLPILADALEESGCTGPDILGHLRSPGPHVRGCWPVDLVLGKS
jgi:hypothetical protein